MQSEKNFIKFNCMLIKFVRTFIKIASEAVSLSFKYQSIQIHRQVTCKEIVQKKNTLVFNCGASKIN